MRSESQSRGFGAQKGRGLFGRDRRRAQDEARRDQRRRATLEALEVRSLLAVLPAPTAAAQAYVSNTRSETSNESTPSIAVDPTNPLNMVATWTRHETNVSNPPSISVEAAYSTDGGLSWQSLNVSNSLANPNTTNPTVSYTRVDEASVGFDRNGNVYILARHHTDNTSGALALSKFNFSGATPTLIFRDRILYQWTPASDQAIHPMLAVDDTVASFTDPESGLIQSNLFTGNVYVGFATVDTAPAGNPAGNQFNPNRIKIMASSDGGLTFSGQTVVNDGSNSGNQRNVRPRLAILQGTPTALGGTPAVEGGTVAVVWDDFGTLATATPPRDILKSDRVAAGVVASASATNGAIGDNTTTNFPININVTDPRFLSVSDLQVRLAITHPALAELRVELVPPVGSGLPTITLFNSQSQVGAGGGISGANLGLLNGFNVGTLFDDSAARRIVDISPAGARGAAAPYVGLFRPEAGSLAAYNGALAASGAGGINGAWTIRVVDTVSGNTGSLNQATLTFTSGVTASADTNITTTFVRGAVGDTYSRATDATAKGLGPGLTVASDRTLGSFSPFQGRLYAAFTQRANTNGNPNDNTDIYLVTSDDGGLNWSFPVLVTDDFARLNGFSEGDAVFGQGISGRPQFQPNVAVDQTTGTVALSWFDTRYDAARARVTTQITTSIDGGQTFSDDIYANRSKTAIDAITGQTVVMGPIPDNQSAANPNTEGTFNYGDRQGLAFAAGRILPVWAGNQNGGPDGRTRLDILTTVLTTAVGPRVYDSTMGPIGLTDQFGNVVDPINSTRAPDGTPILAGFDIIFDRPIDPTTFRPEDVQVFFRDTTPTNVSGGPVPVINVFEQASAPTDPDFFYNPGNVLGYTRFRVQVAPRTAVGTYSYAISPTVNDRIRGASGALGNLGDQDGNANPGEAAITGVGLGDVYAAPRPTSTGPSFQIDPNGINFFAGPYDPHTLPLVLTGPRVIASQVPGSPDSGDDVALNQPVNRLDITFDRDVMASSFKGNDVLRLTGPNGELIQPRPYAASIASGGLAIPDNNIASPLQSRITVNDDGAFFIGDINVSVNITHPRVRDLTLTLIAPDGTRVELANAVGGFAGANFTGTTFDDEATTSITAANAPFTGVFRPSSPLSDLDGKELRGDWILEVRDNAAGQTGTLNSWSFAATPQPRVAPVFNANLGPNGLTIPDGGMIEALLNIAPGSSFTIADLNAAFDIEHARPTDLKIELIGPLGTTITLLNHIGGPLERNILGLTLDDQASLSVTRAAAPFSGIYQPQGPGLLAAYNGQALAGTWRLRITDLAGNGGGTLRNFSLVASPANPSVAARAYRVTFPTQNAPGTYALTLGPNILDRNGNAMDADADAGVDLLRGTALNAPTVSVNYNSADVPRTLADASAVAPGVSTSVLNVPDNFLIADLNITLNISHTKTPDLTAVLIAPDGTRITLFSGVGNVGTQHGFVNTTLDDQATTPIQNGARPFFGTFNPQQPLGVLNGRNAFGTWTLEVTDNSPSGSGTLTGWNLTFARPVPNSGLGEPVSDRSQLSFRAFTMDPTNPLSGNVWTPVGPTSSNTLGDNSNGYAGRVSAIAIDPSDPTGNTVYIGAAAGGVWKSTNFLTTDPNGPTWVPLTDFGPTFGLHISSIAIIPRNDDPNQSILFVTTGEAAAGYGWGSTSAANAPGSTVRGVGFLQSRDGGATWNLLDSTDNTLPFANRDHQFAANGGTAGFRVVADPTPLPTGEYIVYAALAGPAGGFWRSLDTGATWQKMSSDGTHGTRATDIVLDPNSRSVSTGNIDRVFVAFEGHGVYFSPNRGQRLDLMDAGSGARTEIRDSEVGNTPRISVDNAPSPNGGSGRITLAKPALVPSSDPNAAVKNLLYQNWLYAAVATPGGSFEGLYLTKDRGATWTKLRLPNEITTNGNVSRPSNDPNNADYNVAASFANYNLTLVIDPTNPEIVYLGGTSIPRESGLIRVDTSLVRDPYTFVFFENDRPEGGGVRTYDSNGQGPARVKRIVDGPGNIIDPITGFPIRQDYTNLIQDPNAPFVVGSTIYVNNTAAFSNDGTGVRWTPFDYPLYSSPGDFRPSTNVQHAVSVRDPLTGEVRLIFGTDQGIFTGLDRDGLLSSGVGTAVAVNYSRSGNLQNAHMFQGAAQPSTTASQIAGAVFYGANQATGFPSSKPDVLTSGDVQWIGDTNGELDASDVATDQQGLGTVYQYKWPSFGGNVTEFFQVNGIARTRGLIQTSNDPQWPGSSAVYGGLIAMGRFAVNPINGDQVVISSAAGRIFGTTNQARDWTVIGNPGDLDGTYAPALAYGAPDPNGPGGVGNLGNFIYAGTLGGRIFVTQTGGGGGGNAWQNISAGLDGSTVIGIVTSPDRGSHAAYAVTLNGVYYTPDSLASPWQNITGNLFSITQNAFGNADQVANKLSFLTSVKADWRYAIPEDFDTPGSPTHPILYVSGGSGVYRSIDNGGTWTLFPAAVDNAPVDGGYFPSVAVTDLDMSLGRIDPTNGRPIIDPTSTNVLLASTFGRGAFAIRLAPQVFAESLRFGAGSDSGASNSDLITNVVRPVIEGLSAQTAFGAVVSVNLIDLTDPANPRIVGTGTTDADGRFSIQIAAGAFASDGSTDGLKTIGVQATDQAGTKGNIALFRFVLDTLAPAAPGIPDLRPLSDSPLPGQPGYIAGVTDIDNITNIIPPRFSISSLEPPETIVSLLRNDQTNPVGQAPSGSVITDGVAFPQDGVYQYRATQIDLAGNVSLPSDPLTVTIDTTAPAQPAAPTLLPADNTGDPTDNITSIRRPRLIGGNVEPGALVQLIDAAGNVLGEATAEPNGNYTVQPSADLGNGSVSLRVRVVDVAGNISLPSDPLILTISAIAPAAPTLSMVRADDTGVSNIDNITNIVRPRFEGRGTPGLTIELLDVTNGLPNAVVLGTAIVAPDGSWLVRPNQDLANGPGSVQPRLIQARIRDAAGNTALSDQNPLSPTPDPLPVTIDTVPPTGIPTLQLRPQDDTGIPGDNITVRRRPLFIGTGEPGALITLVNADRPNDPVLASGVIAANGNYILPLAADLNNGTIRLQARIQDAAGNVGSPSDSDPSTPGAQPLTVTIVSVAGDFDNDGKADATVYRPSTALWAIAQSTAGTTLRTFGGVNTIPLQGDFDGDGKADLAIYAFQYPPVFFIDRSSAGPLAQPFGSPSAIPAVADFDGDGRTDIAIYEPSNATWYILQSTAGPRVEVFGVPTGVIGKPGDIPIPADYDGDGKADLAVWRPNVPAGTATEFRVRYSNGGARIQPFGAPSWLPVSGDYDADGKTDFALFDRATANWFIIPSATGAAYLRQYGLPSDVPTPGDFDGDGKADLVVYRPASGRYYGTLSGGSSLNVLPIAPQVGDIPLQAPYVYKVARQPGAPGGPPAVVTSRSATPSAPAASAPAPKTVTVSPPPAQAATGQTRVVDPTANSVPTTLVAGGDTIQNSLARFRKSLRR